MRHDRRVRGNAQRPRRLEVIPVADDHVMESVGDPVPGWEEEGGQR